MWFIFIYKVELVKTEKTKVDNRSQFRIKAHAQTMRSLIIHKEQLADKTIFA